MIRRRFSTTGLPPPRDSGRFEHCSEGVQATEVIGQRHEDPFQRHFLQTAEHEAPESDGLLDDSENGLHGLLA